MKISTSTIILVALSTFTYGQATKTIVKKSKNPQFVEEYNVLKKDKEVKHGEYTKYTHKKKTVLSHGNYVHGQREGIWTYYFRNSKVSGQGTYKANRLSGVWDYFDRKGTLEQKYDYDRDSLMYYSEKYSTKLLVETEEGKFDSVKVDSPVMFIGGNSSMWNHITKNMQYPPIARDNNISGVVWVSFIITSKGEMKEITLVSGIGYGCDEEALKAIRLIPAQWIPATIDEKPVTVKKQLPVRFVLN